jgi:hypothetical protein
MTERKPSKPWRVSWQPGNHYDHYRSERAAYDAVRVLADQDPVTRITVHRWERGSWHLYERIDPAGYRAQIVPLTHDGQDRGT